MSVGSVLLVLLCVGTLSWLGHVQGTREPVDDDAWVPAMMLSDWRDTLITLATAHDCVNAYPPDMPPVRAPGVNNFRRGATGWARNSLQADTLMVAWRSTSESPWQVCEDPQQLQGPHLSGFALKADQGTVQTMYSRCGQATWPFILRVAYTMAPSASFYAVRFEVVSLQGPVAASSLQVRVLPLIHSGEGQQIASVYGPGGTLGVVEFVGQGMWLGASASSSVSGVTMSVGPSQGPDSLVAQFLSTQQVHSVTPNVTSPTGALQMGAVFDLLPGQSASVSRFLQVDLAGLLSQHQDVDPIDFDHWAQTVTAAKWTQWLQRSNKATANLSADAKLLFENSLLCLKHAQNPEVGAIAASFHPLYQYKTWTRDGVFASMILDAAGYHAEAEAFLLWLAQAQTRQPDDPMYHTCYSAFTGQPVGFVEPQLDGDGAFMLAVLHHALVERESRTVFLQQVKSRVRELQDYFVQEKRAHMLAPPDYSIWEESSDPVTGNPLPTSYFTFSQAMVFAGLKASSRLETLFFKDTQRAQEATHRAQDIRQAVNTYLWSNSTQSYYRGLWSDTLSPDSRPDTSSSAFVFVGGPWNSQMALSHLDYMRHMLTRDGMGMGRYLGDLFFFKSKFNPCGQEVGADTPPWGVTTMFQAFAELTWLQQDLVKQRLEWMVSRAAGGGMPVGECIDGTTGRFVQASAPDVYEHGGVFVWAELMLQGMAVLPDPDQWDFSASA